MNMLAV